MSTDPADSTLSDEAWWVAMCAAYHRVHRKTDAEIEVELDAVEVEPLTEERLGQILDYVRTRCIEEGIEPPRRNP